MSIRLTDDELTAERRRAEGLMNVCLLHGQMDGANAHRQTAEAIKAEAAQRQREAGN